MDRQGSEEIEARHSDNSQTPQVHGRLGLQPSG